MDPRSSLVVGFKDTHSSGAALAWSLAKARRTGLDVVAVHVAPVGPGGSPRSIGFEAWFVSESHRLAREQVDAVRASTAHGARLSFQPMYGSVVECLGLASSSAVAVVIGDSHGRLRELPTQLARACPGCLVACVGAGDDVHAHATANPFAHRELPWPASHVS